MLKQVNYDLRHSVKRTANITQFNIHKIIRITKEGTLQKEYFKFAVFIQKEKKKKKKGLFINLILREISKTTRLLFRF